MEMLSCPSCGSNRLESEGAFLVCPYCGTRMTLDMPSPESSGASGKSSATGTHPSEIALNDDVQRLLEKCRKFPSRAPKIAKTILEIDPYNQEARKYLG